MDLLAKVLILAVVLIAVLASARYLVSQSPGQVSNAQAVASVTNYLNTNYPGAVVNITSVNASQVPGSWHIVAAIINNASSACPDYFVESFDYPKFGFVPTPQNNYTSGCVIYGVQKGLPYNVTSYPVAVAKSYDYNLTQVRIFMNRYGYSNVQVSATYHNSITLDYKNYSHVWLVTYSDTHAPYFVDVGIAQLNGTLLYVSNSTA